MDNEQMRVLSASRIDDANAISEIKTLLAGTMARQDSIQRSLDGYSQTMTHKVDEISETLKELAKYGQHVAVIQDNIVRLEKSQDALWQRMKEYGERHDEEVEKLRDEISAHKDSHAKSLSETLRSAIVIIGTAAVSAIAGALIGKHGM